MGSRRSSAAAQQWGLRRNKPVETVLYALAGLLLIFPTLIEAGAEALSGRDIEYTGTLGLAILVGVVIWQRMKPGVSAPATT